MLSERKGHHCQHRSDDFPVIASILAVHRPTTVVELGTDEGGFAGFLADTVRPWGGRVVTFDIARKLRPGWEAAFPNATFVQADVLSAEPAARVLELLRGASRALLYCDNGDKPREVALYAQHVPVGSLLGVHDYNTEIRAEWVEPWVASLGFTKEGHERMEALRNQWYPEPMTRLWLRRSEGTP